LTPYHGTEARGDSPDGKAKEKDDDQDREDQTRLRLRLRVGRLPLQSLHLPELRLLKEAGRALRGAARSDQISRLSNPSSTA
jgi:hypothetical protein